MPRVPPKQHKGWVRRAVDRVLAQHHGRLDLDRVRELVAPTIPSYTALRRLERNRVSTRRPDRVRNFSVEKNIRSGRMLMIRRVIADGIRDGTLRLDGDQLYSVEKQETRSE